MNHILIALDGSDHAAEVERVGYKLARKINASVTLATVINTTIDYAMADGQVFETYLGETEHLANEDLNRVKQAHPDVSTGIICFAGNPKEDILELAIGAQASFIVIGTHGRTGLSHLLMGSIAEHIIRHSPIPVVVVPYQKRRH
jgi:nucleotide-binding universal stress UspA family protein